jgi:hypothetical protein
MFPATLELLRELIRLVFELVLLALRFVAVLAGGLLLLAGGIGTPAWLIQLAISLFGGGRSGGPLPPGVMLVLLTAAIPAGWLMVSAANTPGPLGVEADEPRAPELSPCDSELSQGREPVARMDHVEPGDFLHRTVKTRLEGRQEMRLRRASQQAAWWCHRRRPHYVPSRPAG